jgi:Co/Zn/Cd efflux system component
MGISSSATRRAHDISSDGRSRRPSVSPALPISPTSALVVTALQRSAGNAAVARVLQRCVSAAGGACHCAGCAAKREREASLPESELAAASGGDQHGLGADFSDVRVHTDSAAADRVMSRTAIGQASVAGTEHSVELALARCVRSVQRQQYGASNGQAVATIPRIVSDEDIAWVEALLAETATVSPDQTAAQAMGVQREDWDTCLADKVNMAAAWVTLLGATATTVAAALAPDPTTITKWVALGLVTAIIGAALWLLAAILSYQECLRSQANPDEGEIEQLQRQLEQLQQTVDELKRMQGASPAPATP